MKSRIVADYLFKILPRERGKAISSSEIIKEIKILDDDLEVLTISQTLRNYSQNPRSDLVKVFKKNRYYLEEFGRNGGRHQNPIIPSRKNTSHRYKSINDFTNRDQKIIEMYNNELTLQEIGNQFSITRERVRQILLPAKMIGLVDANRPHIISEKARTKMRELGKSRRGRQQKFPKRNAKIETLVSNGLSYSQVATQVGISRSTVCAAMYRAKRREMNSD